MAQLTGSHLTTCKRLVIGESGEETARE